MSNQSTNCNVPSRVAAIPVYMTSSFSRVGSTNFFADASELQPVGQPLAVQLSGVTDQSLNTFGFILRSAWTGDEVTMVAATVVYGECGEDIQKFVFRSSEQDTLRLGKVINATIWNT